MAPTRSIAWRTPATLCAVKVAFQGSRVTSDAGLLLVRELDERLGLEALIAEYLNDSRQGLNTQFSLADLLRQSVYRCFRHQVLVKRA